MVGVSYFHVVHTTQTIYDVDRCAVRANRFLSYSGMFADHMFVPMERLILSSFRRASVAIIEIQLSFGCF